MEAAAITLPRAFIKTVNMDRILKGIMLVVNLIFLIACVVHVTVNGYYILHPQLPSIRILKKNLHNIDFPLAFKLCVSEIKNSAHRYKKVGYLKSFEFFQGKSMHNNSLYGWGGHTKAGSAIASVEGNTSLFDGFTCSIIP